jgi:hypothetical protein
MAESLGSIYLCCDAPSYPIVKACQDLGFRSPLDVRWARLSQANEDTVKAHGLLTSLAWGLLIGRGALPDRTCICGAPLLPLQRHTFLLTPGRQVDYLLTQCFRCHTIFWRDG